MAARWCTTCCATLRQAVIAHQYIMRIVLHYVDDFVDQIYVEMNADELMIIGCSSRKEGKLNKEEKVDSYAKLNKLTSEI